MVINKVQSSLQAVSAAEKMLFWAGRDACTWSATVLLNRGLPISVLLLFRNALPRNLYTMQFYWVLSRGEGPVLCLEQCSLWPQESYEISFRLVALLLTGCTSVSDTIK